MKSLEQIIADQRGELAVLRKHGQSAIADALEQFCNDVVAAAEDYLTWLSETDATSSPPCARTPSASIRMRGGSGNWSWIAPRSPRTSASSKDLRQKVLQRDNWICWICNLPGATTADHVKPYSKGGATILSNLRAAHRSCNSKRGAPHPAGINGKYQ